MFNTFHAFIWKIKQRNYILIYQLMLRQHHSAPLTSDGSDWLKEDGEMLHGHNLFQIHVWLQ